MQEKSHKCDNYSRILARGTSYHLNMNIFSLITLAGGAAFFIFGMKVLSRALEVSAGGRLKKALGSLSSGRIRGAALGAGITAAAQSSSAVTVMLAGFVDSGIMPAENAAAVVMGSNIGTTSTAWVLSLSGQSGNPLSDVFGALIYAAAVAGILLLTVSKKRKRQSAGVVMLGFAVMMNGMEIMQKAAAPISENGDLFLLFKNPLMSLIISALFTAAVQSSSASVGILQALSASGAVSLGSAIPIIAGQNIGTCVTAVLASISLGKNAKRVTAAHLIFNLTGAGIFMLIYAVLNAVGINLSQPVGSTEIALIHTVFNLVSTAVLLPFAEKIPLMKRGKCLT